jgi:type II secretion system protein C
MASYLSWGANAALIVTGCFVTANIANGIIGEWVAPPISGGEGVQDRIDEGGEAAPRNASAIVARNLFRSALVPKEGSAGAAVTDDAGPLEESELPVRLLGTVASDNPAIARAALEDTEKRERLIVSIGDRVKDEATVYRIERRRVVLAENDGMRELSLDDEPPAVASPANRRRAAVDKRRQRPARTPRAAPRVTRGDVQETLRDPSTLFQQARFLPKYDDGKMQGYQVSGIKPGSLVEEMGLGDGDVIVEANGIPIDSPTSGGQLFRQMNEVDELIFMVERPGGEVEEVQVPLDD